MTTSDVAPPTVDSVTVPTMGRSIAIAFNETLDQSTAGVPGAIRFTLTTGDGARLRMGTIAVNASTVTINLHADSPTIRTGQVLTLVYTDPSANDDASAIIQDDDGNDAEGFTAGPSETLTVTNSSTQAAGAHREHPRA